MDETAKEWRPEVRSKVRFGAQFDGEVISIVGRRCVVQFPSHRTTIKLESLKPNFMPPAKKRSPRAPASARIRDPGGIPRRLWPSP